PAQFCCDARRFPPPCKAVVRSFPVRRTLVFWWASRLLISLLTIVTACEPYPAKSAYQRDQARHADNDPFGSRHRPHARDYNLSRGNWPAAAHTNRTTSTPIAM